MTLEQELIAAQQQIITLQQRIDEMTPKNAPDEEVFWHIASGVFSEDAASSNDLYMVRRFRDWNVTFAHKFLKPYLNPSVYGECLNQMTRGLNARISALQAQSLKPERRTPPNEPPNNNLVRSMEEWAREQARKNREVPKRRPHPINSDPNRN